MYNVKAKLSLFVLQDFAAFEWQYNIFMSLNLACCDSLNGIAVQESQLTEMLIIMHYKGDFSCTNPLHWMSQCKQEKSMKPLKEAT
jgi:hypothetical protein